MSVEPRPVLDQQRVRPKRTLRVAEISRYIRRLIEDDKMLTEVSVLGEVTNLSQAGSGHIYFSLKDDNSQLACAMMRTQAAHQPEQVAALRQGVNVVADGWLTVYEPRGTYQLSVQKLEIQGAGAARLRLERLRRKLELEGLFAEERKRPIPSHPRILALVTSPQSQAYYDVIKRLQEQWPRVTVIVAGVSVQGEQAPGEISLAIDIVNRMTSADAILLVRGGGSPEELQAFNDERVARAIFASRIPVITGIGHTQDWTIADYVADVRATTPTGAASAAVPDGVALRKNFNRAHSEIRAHVLRGIQSRRNHVLQVNRALLRASPSSRIANRRQRLDETWELMRKNTTADLNVRRRRLDALSRQMDALNPLAVLSRGYALLTDARTGELVVSVEQATPGRKLVARVKDGSFITSVEASN